MKLVAMPYRIIILTSTGPNTLAANFLEPEATSCRFEYFILAVGSELVAGKCSLVFLGKYVDQTILWLLLKVGIIL